MIGQFIFAKLNGATAADNRIFPMTAPEGQASPKVIYQEIGTGSVYSARGGVGLADARVQITALASTPDAAAALLERIRVLLHGFVGAAGGVTVQHCLMIDGTKHDVPYIAAGNEVQTTFGKAADFNIFHIEPIP